MIFQIKPFKTNQKELQMTNIIKYKSRRSSRDHANCPSERANDNVSFEKRQLRRSLRRQLKAIGEESGSRAMHWGTYWT